MNSTAACAAEKERIRNGRVVARGEIEVVNAIGPAASRGRWFDGGIDPRDRDVAADEAARLT